MVILRKCCFCCPLTTGAIVLGCFIMISSFLMVIIHSLCLIYHRNIMDFREDAKYNLDFSKAFKVRHGVGVARHFLMALIAILLIIGAMKRRVQFLYPFLFTYVIYFVYSVIIAFSSYTGVINLLTEVIVFAWAIYWWLCVLSLYQEIKEEEKVRPSDTI